MFLIQIKRQRQRPTRLYCEDIYKMPKKRNNSASQNKKVKQIITARLMEISLKVDDCIYKQKPISVGEAEQYRSEVSSYIQQCSGDERSLQVIEKLSRCMKAIILDHQELGTVNHSIQDATSIQDDGQLTGSISPVYSIPDEDRTQFTQIAEARDKNVTVANQDVEIIDLSTISDDDLMDNDTSPTTTDYASSRITVEADIHREMSCLSLRDVGEPLNTTASVVDCSQSILNHFEGIEQIQQKGMDIILNGDGSGGFIGNVADKGNPINIMQVGNIAFGQIPNKNTVSIIDPKKTVKSTAALNKHKVSAFSHINKTVQNKEPLKDKNTLMPSNVKDNSLSSHTFYPSTNVIHETQRSWFDLNRTCTINNSKHTLKDVNNYTTQASPIHKVMNIDTVKNTGNLISVPTITINAVEKENQPLPAAENSNTLISNADVVLENSITTKKKRGPRKKKIIDENETKTKSKKAYRAPKSNKNNTTANKEKNKLIPIYNENVVNDLSWMENIRYVREIRIDENDPKLNLEESFWQNCYLPANWSDSEFL